MKKEVFLFNYKAIALNNNIKKVSQVFHYIIFFLFSWSTCKASKSFLASSWFLWDFLSNAFPFYNNLKFLFFSVSSEILRKSA